MRYLLSSLFVFSVINQYGIYAQGGRTNLIYAPVEPSQTSPPIDNTTEATVSTTITNDNATVIPTNDTVVATPFGSNNATSNWTMPVFTFPPRNSSDIWTDSNLTTPPVAQLPWNWSYLSNETHNSTVWFPTTISPHLNSSEGNWTRFPFTSVPSNWTWVHHSSGSPFPSSFNGTQSWTTIPPSFSVETNTTRWFLTTLVTHKHPRTTARPGTWNPFGTKAHHGSRNYPSHTTVRPGRDQSLSAIMASWRDKFIKDVQASYNRIMKMNATALLLQ